MGKVWGIREARIESNMEAMARLVDEKGDLFARVARIRVGPLGVALIISVPDSDRCPRVADEKRRTYQSRDIQTGLRRAQRNDPLLPIRTLGAIVGTMSLRMLVTSAIGRGNPLNIRPWARRPPTSNGICSIRVTFSSLSEPARAPFFARL